MIICAGRATIRVLPNAMDVAAVCVAPVSAISAPIPTRSSLASIANARTSAVSDARICYALDRIMAPVSAIAVCANRAGRATAATVKHRRIPACHRVAARFALAMAPASAAFANANPWTKAAIRANTATNAPHARAVVMT